MGGGADRAYLYFEQQRFGVPLWQRCSNDEWSLILSVLISLNKVYENMSYIDYVMS